MNIFLLLFAAAAIAKTTPTKVFKDPKSQCQVRQFGGANDGDYPGYKIYRKSKLLFPLKYDGVLSVLFSPSGTYIALGNSEMDSFGKSNLLIVNCGSGAKKGFVAASCSITSGEEACIGNTAEPKSWSADERSLKYTAHVDGKDRTETLVFGAKNSLP